MTVITNGSTSALFNVDGQDYENSEYRLYSIAVEDAFDGALRVRTFYGIQSVRNLGFLVYPKPQEQYTVLGNNGVVGLDDLLSSGSDTGSTYTGKTKHVFKTGESVLSEQDQLITTGVDKGKRAIVSVNGSVDATVTIPNISNNIDSNYLFSNIGQTSVLQVVPDEGVTFLGIGKGTNNAFRLLSNVDRVSDALAVEIEDGFFKITGNDLEWYTLFSDLYPSGSPESDTSLEGTDISMWQTEGGAGAALLENTITNTGNHAFKTTGSAAIRVYRDYSNLFTIGQTYRFTFRLNQTVGDGTRIYWYNENSLDTQKSIGIHFMNDTAGWYTYTFDWVADSTGIRMAFLHVGATVQEALMDNASIVLL